MNSQDLGEFDFSGGRQHNRTAATTELPQLGSAVRVAPVSTEPVLPDWKWVRENRNKRKSRGPAENRQNGPSVGY